MVRRFGVADNNTPSVAKPDTTNAEAGDVDGGLRGSGRPKGNGHDKLSRLSDGDEDSNPSKRNGGGLKGGRQKSGDQMRQPLISE